MLKNLDVFGLTRNLDTLYSRHVIYSAFLLGSPTFSSATSTKLTCTCYERTALHFHLHSKFAFQASPTPDCLLQLSVSCLSLFQVLQSSYCFKIADNYLCPQSCLWLVVAEFPEKLPFFSSVLYKERLYRKKTGSC